MEIKKVIAIFDELRFEDIQNALVDHAVTEFSAHKIQGRGRYYDSFNRNHLIAHIQLEVYTNAEYAKKIADLILSVAYVNSLGEGMVAIEPVNELFWIHTKSRVSLDDFNYKE
ncbi:MAG: P-II family nitrogen regulator [Oleispira sp.]|nr:P-II family nitrogen regulator [Oleispira sp.]